MPHEVSATGEVSAMENSGEILFIRAEGSR